MPKQMSFFDLDRGPLNAPPTGIGSKGLDLQPSNLFFALAPPQELADHIGRQANDWDRQQGLGGKLLTADLLHVSLHAIGFYIKGVPLEAVEFAERIGNTLSAQAFDMVFDRAMSFRGRKAPYVLRLGEGVDRIRALWTSLGIAIADAGGQQRNFIHTAHDAILWRAHRAGAPYNAHFLASNRTCFDQQSVWQVSAQGFGALATGGLTVEIGNALPILSARDWG